MLKREAFDPLTVETAIIRAIEVLQMAKATPFVSTTREMLVEAGRMVEIASLYLEHPEVKA
jgi:hypothetical protein